MDLEKKILSERQFGVIVIGETFIVREGSQNLILSSIEAHFLNLIPRTADSQTLCISLKAESDL